MENEFLSNLYLATSTIIKEKSYILSFEYLDGHKIIQGNFNTVPQYIYTFKNEKNKNLKIITYQASPLRKIDEFTWPRSLEKPNDIMFSDDCCFIFIKYQEKIVIFSEEEQIKEIKGSYNQMLLFENQLFLIDHNKNCKIYNWSHIRETIEQGDVEEKVHFDFTFQLDTISISKFYFLVSNSNVLNLYFNNESQLKILFPCKIIQSLGSSLLEKIFCLCEDNKIYVSSISLQNPNKSTPNSILELDETTKIIKIMFNFSENCVIVITLDFIYLFDTFTQILLEKIKCEDVNDSKIALESITKYQCKPWSFSSLIKSSFSSLK